LKAGIKSRYLHSDIDALERIQILRDLRLGKFDVLVGINLLREGLDLPEVSLVVILDADKEGFLRAERSLIQTMGRAARNVAGRVILFADKLTDSMDKAIRETNRRRQIQIEYNKKHNITPKTIKKAIYDNLRDTRKIDEQKQHMKEVKKDLKEIEITKMHPASLPTVIAKLTHKMEQSAKNLEFEIAAIYRDQIEDLEERLD